MSTPMKIAMITLAALILARPGNTQGNSAAAEAVSSICEEIEYMQTLNEHLNGELRRLNGALTNLEAEERMLILAAARQEDIKKSTAYQLLAAEAGRRRALASNELRVKRGLLEEASKLTAKRTEQLQTLLQLHSLGAMTASESAAQEQGAGTFGVTTEKCQLTVTIAAGRAQKCQTSVDKKRTIKNAGNELQTLRQLKGVALSDFRLPAFTAIVESAGSFDGDSHKTGDGQAHCGNHATAASATIGVTLASLTKKSATEIKISTQAVTENTQCVKPDSSDSEETLTLKTLASKLCELQKQPINLQALVQDTDGDSLVSDSNFQNLAVLASGQDTKELTSAEDKKKAAQRILGSDKPNIKQTFFKPLENKDITIKEGTSQTKTSVKEAANGPNFGRALSLFAGQTLKREETTAKQITKAEPKEEGCTGKEKDYCHAKNGCKYNEKDSTCEKDPAKATAAPTDTNTTGINSFVIKKASLVPELFSIKIF